MFFLEEQRKREEGLLSLRMKMEGVIIFDEKREEWNAGDEEDTKEAIDF